MNDSQRRRNERLVRASDFGAARATDFPATSKGGEALARLNQFLADIESKDSSSFTNLRVSQQATNRREEARNALRQQLSTISDAADTIGLDHPEVKDKFRRPRGNSNDQTLISVARSFAAEATTFRALFLEYDMPADFLSRLNQSIEDLDQSIEQQNTGTNAGRSDRAATEQLLKQGETELERLDTAVRIKYLNDKAVLAAWESASRLERGPRKNKNASAPSPQK